VNRAYRKCHSIGGKGQNFAIACQQYGYVDKVSILQFTGGLTGSYIKSELNDKNVHHIDGNFER
jgi:fructose-1-phosphate kinase PfkB-like protein